MAETKRNLEDTEGKKKQVGRVFLSILVFVCHIFILRRFPQLLPIFYWTQMPPAAQSHSALCSPMKIWAFSLLWQPFAATETIPTPV